MLVSYQKNPDAATGTCAVLVNGGERSLVANLAAANTFTHAHLETTEAKDIIKKAQIFYISGFFLTVSVDSILAIAKHSVEENKIFIMNLSAPFLIQFFGDQMAATMPYTDFVFGNESEASLLLCQCHYRIPSPHRRQQLLIHCQKQNQCMAW